MKNIGGKGAAGIEVGNEMNLPGMGKIKERRKRERNEGRGTSEHRMDGENEKDGRRVGKTNVEPQE
jgi:hypothetical protein